MSKANSPINKLANVKRTPMHIALQYNQQLRPAAIPGYMSLSIAQVLKSIRTCVVYSPRAHM